MGNIFDSLSKSVFKVVSSTMGYPATWKPFDSNETYYAQVLYKDATEAHGLSNQDYEIERYVMEYPNGAFVGLLESVQNANTETIKIEIETGTWLEFMVRRVETKYDGKTIIAFLNPPK